MTHRMAISLALASAVGCTPQTRGDDLPQGADGALDGDGPVAGEGDGTSVGGDDGDSPDGDDDGDDGTVLLDVGHATGGALPCEEGGGCDEECAVPPHEPCDGDSDDLLHAIGLACPDELPIEGGPTGSPMAMGVRAGFGPTSEWAPREGSRIAVLGTGLVSDLDQETPQGDQAISPTHCNDDLGPQFDPGIELPAPLRPVDVAGDCASTPGLVGTGDCSSSIQKQWQQGASANDYTELRVVATVPAGSLSISYDLAFFSTEYPFYYFSEFNDMFVGWLESEDWTGNVSFDEAGNPISLNASFLDFRDDAGTLPELQGTCMRMHAGTKWLTTTAPVVPGEEITLVLAIFDLSDSILDSYVLLDNFQWGCEGDGTPSTVPVG